MGLWVAWMRAGGAPDTTVGLRRYYVTRFCADHPRSVLTVRAETMAAWIAAQDWSPNTIKSCRSSLRGFYRWLQVTGRITESPAHLLPPVRVPRSRPRPAPEVAVRSAMLCADPRAVLAVRLGAFCGLRRGEVARCAREDLSRDLLGWSLRVVGKGGHVREVPVPDGLAVELLGMPAGWLFPSPYAAGPGHLTPHHVSKLVSRALPAGVTMHMLRHRCATVAYAGTHDLRAVQELLGHSRPETTAGYIATPAESVRAAVAAAAA